MRVVKITIFLIFTVLLNGCVYTTPSYEVFVKMYANFHTGKSFIPKNFGTHRRKIYDENRYVYISEYPKGCIVGYLTNRDDKPEVVQEWIILSGKENCKITESFVLIQ